MSSSVQNLCRPINTALFSSKRLLPRRLGNVWCHSSSNSTNLHTPTTTSTTNSAKLDQFEEAKVNVLKQKMELLGVLCNHSCVPGRYYNLLCPKCNGGQSMERSLSFHIVQNGQFAMWRCFRFDCGWAGRAFADDRAVDNGANKKGKSTGQLTEKSLGLVPLCEELIAYFRERMISEETLSRNGVMKLSRNKLIIAFTYRQNGLLVGCKYRTVEKRFWQEKDTEKVLYGLDDIIDATEIIIVEGELDKLSVEEAGFQNCVSVPGGAPGKMSNELPSIEKASRIILATDGDAPWQVLAEELARRLGKDRCWQVRWPEKDGCSCFKDANEVLRFMGPSALKNVIENAELYQ